LRGERLVKKIREGYIDLKHSCQIKNEFDRLDISELKIYKDECLVEMKAELAVRYKNSEARIEEYLNNDSQFQAALKILSNDALYNMLIK